MRVSIHPNQKRCPLCAGTIHIEDGLIYCTDCTANFVDPEWARSADENHEVTFDSFEEETTAAEAMRRMTETILGGP